ncbi:MAG: acyltransferase, partial [Geodermatophilaceae bacterium]|nr:acyltransferase [Geodermatophilaceae bacterium]
MSRRLPRTATALDRSRRLVRRIEERIRQTVPAGPDGSGPCGAGHDEVSDTSDGAARAPALTYSPRSGGRVAWSGRDIVIGVAGVTDTIARPDRERRRGRRKSTFRPDIQGLRAVAVLLVVANHAGVPGIPGGFVGVDVFFVISGFLITGLLVREGRRGQGISLTDFYARRARRILPAASLVLLATVAGSVLFLGSVRASEVGQDAVWSAFFAINWKFSAQGTS